MGSARYPVEDSQNPTGADEAISKHIAIRITGSEKLCQGCYQIKLGVPLNLVLSWQANIITSFSCCLLSFACHSLSAVSGKTTSCVNLAFGGSLNP